MLKTALSAAALFIAQGTLAAGLSASQSRVAAAVDAGEARNEALLEKLVNINSGSFNPAGVQSVARELESELKSLDFEVRWVNEDAVKRAPSLLATHRGGRGKRVLLLGHMDTVFEPSHPFQRMTREGKRIAGPGVNDMKGGLVIIVGALRALAREIDVVWPLHPRTRKVLAALGVELDGVPSLHVTGPLGYLDMIELQAAAALVVTDSGGVQKEAFFFGRPCVTLRDETEWIELVDAGWNRLAPPTSVDALTAAMRAALGSRGAPVRPYGDGDAAQRIDHLGDRHAA